MSLSTLLMQMVIAIRSWTACLISRSVFNITWTETQKTLYRLEETKCFTCEIWAKRTSEERMRSNSLLLPHLWRAQFHPRSEYSTWLHQRNWCDLKKTRFYISICQDPNQDRWLETQSTWGIHNVEEIRFAPGVWQDHCDGGTLDANSPLQKQSPPTGLLSAFGNTHSNTSF